jgi:hypothetical protein
MMNPVRLQKRLKTLAEVMAYNAALADAESREGDDRAFVDSLGRRGVTASLRGNALKFHPYHLDYADRQFVRRHRESLKALIRSGYTPAIRQAAPAVPAQKAAEPAPTLFANGKPVTEEMVIASLRNLGDAAVEEYRKGKTSKASAYAMAQAAAIQTGELRRCRRMT